LSWHVWVGEIDDLPAVAGCLLSKQPMKLPVPPQGYRSVIEGPVRAAVPQLIGKAD
jgi:hypothetical protein